VDRERRQDPRGQALVLEDVLERERVDDRREHAHRVAGRLGDAVLGDRGAADDVAAADHDRDLGADRGGFLDLRAIDWTSSMSMPVCPSLQNASPLILSSTRLYLGGMEED
jgi:hypothetical protein